MPLRTIWTLAPAVHGPPRISDYNVSVVSRNNKPVITNDGKVVVNRMNLVVKNDFVVNAWVG